ncbi:PQQ-dependent sugar dehydrogenase [Sphingomonas sp. HDW15A]|uniref:PQQ-dependent sugar dehydrogenase n=1 Tax=Sphingomonas sp. HDW15A TaxID=2714942 RepID=UPI00140D2A14|nr:PQQ-dependent sugar dehydrogenase [Sphingomonas sp. HDW15A]QIK97110.1 PQQ-dependent sugar dehydrogenase [Sphingomonas sp. HDW15A]
MRPLTILTGAIAIAACADGSNAQADRPSEAASATPFAVAEVTDFGQPWAMDFLPGSGVRKTKLALVTEKTGELWLVDVGNGSRKAVAGAPKVLVAGQGGLGDVVAHPDFAGNRRVYISFVEAGEAGGTSGAVLGYGTLNLQGEPRIDNFKVIWRQQPKVEGNGHFSHRIAFGPDGFLYLTSGDRQKFDPAQDLSGNLGKVLRLTDEGAPAPGNPWASRGGVTAQIWSMGHRNLLGLDFAPDGRLWQVEMGPKHGDELNLVLSGKNYGWPRVSMGSHYDGRDIPDHKPGDGFEAPKAYWVPAISPGGMIIYKGELFRGWKGDAIVTGLSGQSLSHVDIEGDRVVAKHDYPMGARIRAVDEGPDGALYVLEDGGRGSSGRLLRLTPAR